MYVLGERVPVCHVISKRRKFTYGNSSYRSGVPLLMGRPVYDSAGERKWDRDPASCFAFNSNGSLFYASDKISSGPPVSGHDPGFERKETGGRRPVTDPDFVCVHSNPSRNGKPRGSCCGDLGRRCRCCILDVAVGGAWGLHSVCGGGFSAAL